jgi:hypothetical protein
MPFQSEKQRRYLHANHPEIAKRWEEEYATGGISNHFRRKFASGTWHPGVGRDEKGYQKSHPSHGGGGGDGPPSIVHAPKGPTAAEIAAAKAKAKAKAEAEKRALEIAANKKHVKDFKDKQKKKSSWFSNLTYHPLLTQKTELPPSMRLGTEFEKLNSEVPSDINLKFTKDTADAFKIGNIAATTGILNPSSLIKLSKDPKSVSMLRGLDLVDSPKNQTGFEKQGLSSDYRHTLGTSAFKDSIIDYLSKNLNVSPNNKVLDTIGSVTAKGATIFEEGKDAFRALDTYNKEHPYSGIQDYDDIPGENTLTASEILAQPKEDFEANWFAADQIPHGTKPEEKMNMVKAYRDYGIDNYKDQLAKEKKMDMQETITKAEEEFVPYDEEQLINILSNFAKGGIANHFKLKDGGTPQLAKKSKDGTRPGYGGPQDWGQQERAEKQAAATGHAGSEGTGGYAGKSHAEMQSLSQASPSHGGMETEWSQSKEYKDAGYEPVGLTTEEKVEKSKEWMEEEVIKVLRKKDLTKEQKRRQLQWQYEQMKKGYDTFGKLKKAAAVHPIVAVLVGLFEGHKAKKAQEEEIKQLELKLGDLKDWDLNTRHHAIDTPYQILEQRILDLQQPRTVDDTTGDDGPPTPILVPAVIDEMAEATGEINMFDAWDRIKRNQALYAARQSADDTKVGEWVGDQRLLVNSGGLANLFRVKNQ